MFVTTAFLCFFIASMRKFCGLTGVSFTKVAVFLVVYSIFPGNRSLQPIIFRQSGVFMSTIQVLCQASAYAGMFPDLRIFGALYTYVTVRGDRTLGGRGTIYVKTCILKTLVVVTAVFLGRRSMLSIAKTFVVTCLLCR